MCHHNYIWHLTNFQRSVLPDSLWEQHMCCHLHQVHDRRSSAERGTEWLHAESVLCHHSWWSPRAEQLHRHPDWSSVQDCATQEQGMLIRIFISLFIGRMIIAGHKWTWVCDLKKACFHQIYKSCFIGIIAKKLTAIQSTQSCVSCICIATASLSGTVSFYSACGLAVIASNITIA